MGDAARERAKVYGEDDLSSLPVFGGGYINFGYWAGIPVDGPIGQEQRVDSQLALYRLVYAGLTGKRVVEVGSGTGVGAVWAHRTVRPAELHGVDLHPEQVERARARVEGREGPGESGLDFRQGAADALPFPDASADAVVSVEAAQHFDALAPFAAEAHRVLVPGGRLVVATFFLPSPDTRGRLPRLLETFETGLDAEHDLPGFLDDLRAAGFADVVAESVGDHVWEPLHAWIVQLGVPEDHWSRRWLTCWRDGLIDYYMVTARA